ncbi:hypothetical protein P153DRAFT_355866 [Dothidotthia symphoricarpi CBS 119687]|uniref:Uncharacterized protein n=1 Tax=Dothidotthia symphoricarpi CBS 119687 TaxID=1392245 RepID=A0A6A6AJ11_9PLEO|nr:uncharacterized protein P153DRAFT_355866 [Dothidotthia symphoricarpi CBS 119687]KAF2131085.1 hypothetical protein P153DRAFT_355866 [Dothidotthia symphoricarpi CBS 119687]
MPGPTISRENPETYIVKDIDTDHRSNFANKYGEVEVRGYVNGEDFETAIETSVKGTWAGPLYGNLKDGLVVKYDDDTKGEFKLYLKNGTEVWLRVDFSSLRLGDDHKLITV